MVSSAFVGLSCWSAINGFLDGVFHTFLNSVLSLAPCSGPSGWVLVERSLAIVPDDSCGICEHPLAEPFVTLIATSTWVRTWGSMMLSHPLIYRASAKRQAVNVFAAPGHCVDMQFRELWHHEEIYRQWLRERMLLVPWIHCKV